ncbi:MAG: flagellar basal body-associated FliL family protein, partial [Aquabacterium sp.]
GGGGGAVFMMKKKAAEAAAAAEDEDGGHAPAKAQKKDDKAAPPVFMPLEVFTVNLADREADRYAQIGITLELDDAKTSDQIKVYMPAIRNNILMVIAHKTAENLISKEGKVKLAQEVQREALKSLGVEMEKEEDAADDAAEPKADKPAKAKKKKAMAAPSYPIKAVHFSNFIIQ